MSLQDLLKTARKRGASDVLVMVGDAPAICVAGHWIRIAEGLLCKDEVDQMVAELLDEASLQNLQRVRELDFSRSFTDIGRIRCNVHYQRDHLALVLRLLWPEIPSAQELGIPRHVIATGSLHDGLILVCGATGSGKSTTLAAIVEFINQTRDAHVVTVEDPIEFIYTNKKSLIEQREVGNDTTTWQAALRNVLRQAPDVIVLGELRDLESIQMALSAAETGHLVMASVHATTAIGAVTRILDVFPSSQIAQIRLQLSQSIRMVFAQRLIPGRTPNTRALQYEILMGTKAIQNLIRNSDVDQISNLIHSGREHGMMSFAQCRQDLVARGLVAAET